MKEKILLFIFVSLTSLTASSQTLLTTGDRCTASFAASNFIFFPTGPGSHHPVFGEMVIRLNDTTLPAGTILRYEMFEDDTEQAPIGMGVITETNADPSVTSCNVSNVWADLQGTIRLTMVKGSVTLHSVSLQVGRFSEGEYQKWMGGVVATPDPRLVITARPSAQVELSWATNLVGFSLEAAPTLPAVAWMSVTNSVETVGGRFSVVLDAKNPQAAFRLRKP